MPGIGCEFSQPAQLLRCTRIVGAECLPRRRQSEAHLPAIALTALARADDRNRALSAGYQLHLAKPVEAANLRIAIAEVLRRGPSNA